jgi:ribosomal protein S18 acetylase RimI-like enzyme
MALVLRRAVAEDRPAILAISATIWDGRDYLPRVLDKWLEDQQGYLTVALLDDQLVGISRLALPAVGHGWLEGARVHPDCQGQGVGKAMTRHLVEEARKLGLRSLRYTTSTDNWGSRKLAQTLGFQERGIWRRYTATPGPIAFSPSQYTGEIPTPKNGMIPFSWKLVPWQEELAVQWRKEQAVWGTAQAGMVLVRDSRPERMLVPLLWGEAAHLSLLLAFARMARPGVEKIHFVTENYDHEQALLAAGFKRAEIDMVLYDFPMA